MPDKSWTCHAIGDEGPAPEHFTVGDWLVESSLDRLSRAGAVIHLRPQLTDLLLLLARRAGRTVPKHVILGEVWGSEYVGDSALTRCIAELRQALGDDARKPRIIETIPKRGYRLVAPVVFLPVDTVHAVPCAIASPNAVGAPPSVTIADPRAAACFARDATADPDTDLTLSTATPPMVGTRQWLRETHWKLLLALAVVIAVALAAGRCGRRVEVARLPARADAYHMSLGRSGVQRAMVARVSGAAVLRSGENRAAV